MTLTGRGDTPTREVPVEPGFWLLVLGDMTMFAVFFGSFLIEQRNDPAVFGAGRSDLNQLIGTANTVVLLTGSLVVALGVKAVLDGRHEIGSRYLLAGVGCAGLFTALKAVEYLQKLDAGITPATDTFFTYYFALTGIHLVHVLIATGLLWHVAQRARRGHAVGRPWVQAAGVVWHAVDIIWLLLFAVIYLAGPLA
ncbi:cytochrome c oxidase subunit 3 [Aeromicrobium alkaliterrae]|uniref:Cytochrome aa3 subunit 3 n=1 Tax=Aeromicrobium alkaliterrae TaxID=302168 RepID=A0ABP4WEV6_9ACTN